ncbi:MAG: hypothetical protein ABW054_07210 [Casimicrobiaceae bacterium]
MAPGTQRKDDVPRILFLVPTRNRAALARNAIGSLIEEPGFADGHEVLVSDNSTSAGEASELQQFCASLPGRTVRYFRPPAPLAMPAHWNAATQHALAVSECSHVCILTDRMVLRAGFLAILEAITGKYPNAVLSYNHDRIADNTRPIWLEQSASSDGLAELDSAHLLSLASQGILPGCLPRMLNSVAPREVLLDVSKRFGNFFGSTAPDYNFAFRCLETQDSILFLDSALLVHYAIGRSNGASFASGRPSRDNRDFLANLEAGTLNGAAPYPEIWTTDNTIFHEYCVVREQTHSPKLPPLDIPGYVLHLTVEINEIDKRQVRRRMRALLRSRCREDGLDDLQGRYEPLPSLTEPLALLKSLHRRLKRSYWDWLERRTNIRLGRLTRFWNRAAALRYARTIPRPTTDKVSPILLAPSFKPRLLSEAFLPHDAVMELVRSGSASKKAASQLARVNSSSPVA